MFLTKGLPFSRGSRGSKSPLSVPSYPSTTSSSASPATTEFRPYRRFVTIFVLAFVSIGSVFMLTSVGVSIYRQRYAVPVGEPVGVILNENDMRGCAEELGDVTLALQKHLENFHFLLGGYNPDQAQTWSDEGAVWRSRWKLLGTRCRLNSGATGKPPAILDQIVALHRELDETERVYTRELLKFGRDQAPRLDRVKQRLAKIADRLDNHAAPPGDETP